MAFRAIWIGLLLSSLLIAGCGTVENLIKPGPEGGGKTPFGGVRQDVWCIKAAASGEYGSSGGGKPELEPNPQVGLMLLCAADLPFSLLGDIVTWPYTAAYSCINQPIPTPPVTQVPTEGPLPAHLTPQNSESETKTPEKDTDQGKRRDDKPAQLPMPRLQPGKQTP